MSNAERPSEGKPWWQSRTIIGAAAAILATVLGMVFKAEIPNEDVTELLLGLAAVVGSALAIYGRIKAKGPVEVRKAVRATPEEISKARGGGQWGGNRKNGYAQLPVLVAAACWICIALLCVAVMEIGRASGGEDRTDLTDRTDLVFPDITETPDLSGWIKYSPPVDARPFLARLLDSLRFWAEVSTPKGKARVDESGAVVSGTYRDNERPAKNDLEPRRYAVGVTGGADF
jgi:hypothetical protein